MLNICFIRDLCRSIQELEAAVQKEYNLTLNECMLICTLSCEECCSSGHMADALRLTCSNTSKVIKSTEEKGLIKRMLGDKDKRQMNFVLTDKGKQTLKIISENSESVMPDFLKRIQKSELSLK